MCIFLLINPVCCIPILEALNVFNYLIYYAEAGFFGCPGNVRGDDQLIAVLDFQKRILRVHGLFAKHIQTCCPNGTFCKSGIQICLIDNCTSCQVQKMAVFFILRKFSKVIRFSV